MVSETKYGSIAPSEDSAAAAFDADSLRYLPADTNTDPKERRNQCIRQTIPWAIAGIILVSLALWFTSDALPHPQPHEGIHGSTTTTTNRSPRKEPPLRPAVKCSAHDACEGLIGDCCPTAKGILLDCCGR